MMTSTTALSAALAFDPRRGKKLMLADLTDRRWPRK